MLGDRVVIVTGAREWRDRGLINNALDRIGSIDLLVHGGCVGADRLAADWAHSRQIPSLAIPAQWDLYGRRAGPIRNRRMLRLLPGALVVAFPLQGSRGTRGCVQLAEGLGMPVWELGPEGEFTELPEWTQGPIMEV